MDMWNSANSGGGRIHFWLLKPDAELVVDRGVDEYSREVEVGWAVWAPRKYSGLLVSCGTVEPGTGGVREGKRAALRSYKGLKALMAEDGVV